MRHDAVAPEPNICRRHGSVTPPDIPCTKCELETVRRRLQELAELVIAFATKERVNESVNDTIRDFQPVLQAANRAAASGLRCAGSAQCPTCGSVDPVYCTFGGIERHHHGYAPDECCPDPFHDSGLA